MISNKHITKIAAILMSMVFIFCVVAYLFPDMLSSVIVTDTAYSMKYADELFDTSEIIDINIIMNDTEWQEMLDNATREEYYKCDVIVNGTTFYSVGIRPKGNTSLSSIANDPNNNRYSFKLEFDQFVDGQTCFGLDKLILNNNYADSTNMKEAIIYDMFKFLGADASLYNYAEISVNDSYWGIYLALESVEDSFMLRNYGTENGKLYKPDNMNHNANDDKNGGGNPQPPNNAPQNGFPDGNPPEMGNFPDKNNMPSTNNAPDEVETADVTDNNIPRNVSPNDEANSSQGETVNEEEWQNEQPRQDHKRNESRGGNPGGGPGMGGNGTNLNYSDDSLDSYSAIWNSSVNGSTDADHRRVINALKNVSERKNIEGSLDVDSLLKYMAVHTFSVNDDSLSGGMAHNYYLYEANGKLNIIPWDYNLAFGGMNGGNATDVVNEPIDEQFSSTDLFDIFLEDEEYLRKYHSYYNQLIEGYVESGKFEETYNRIRGQIDALVESDPNAMYSYEEYLVAVETFYSIIMLRAESISGQLDGSVPSTSEEQRNNSESLIDASYLNISDMGQFMGGGHGGGRDGFERRKEEEKTPNEQTGNETNTTKAESGDNNG